MMHMDPAYVPDIPKMMQQLRTNHLEPAYFETSEQALEWIKRRLRIGSRVAIGGSNTLRDIGVTAYIENGDFRYTNRYVKGHRFQLDPALPQDEVRKSYLDAFTADFYLMSSNAVTEEGELVNVDGQGNRVAALAYGPQEVIVVVGRNKIVRDRREAFERLGRIIGSGGMNAEMLEEHIKRAKSLTDKPFGVNLMLMNPECDKMAELLVREGVPVVTTGAGSPSKYMEMWKAAGIKVAPVVSGAALARRLEQAGADLDRKSVV